jgi:hypothetical protein
MGAQEFFLFERLADESSTGRYWIPPLSSFDLGQNRKLLGQEGFKEQDLPIIIEVVDDAQRIERILPRLDEVIRAGLITLETTHVALYRERRATSNPARHCGGRASELIRTGQRS